MPSPFHASRHTDELMGVGYSHNVGDDKRDATLVEEMVDTGLNSDETSDMNPGGLTFEEGLSLQLCLQGSSLTCELDTAGGMGRHLGVFSCTMLK